MDIKDLGIMIIDCYKGVKCICFKLFIYPLILWINILLFLNSLFLKKQVISLFFPERKGTYICFAITEIKERVFQESVSVKQC